MFPSFARLLSRPDPRPCSRRRRDRSPRIDSLESRSLMAVPGVTFASGIVTIQGTQRSGNVASVAIDPADGSLDVTLNGQTESFDPNAVNAIVYYSGAGGHDAVDNSTSETMVFYGLGGGNDFHGGSGIDVFFLFGPGNTVDDDGGGAFVYRF